jgi:uncharacterized RDD family membrane protein YckC
VSYPPPGPNDPYGQNPYGQPPQQPQQPGYGSPQQPPQPGYGYPQGAPQPGYGAPQPGYDPNAAYGYPQQPGYPGAGYGGPVFAGWWQRFGALLLDTLIAGVPSWILTAIGVAANMSALQTLGSVVSLAIWLYLIYLQGTRGQSVGQKVIGIRLAREADGQNTGFGLAFGRQLLHILDALPCYLGFLWPAWDSKKQTFADKILNTLVVKV